MVLTELRPLHPLLFQRFDDLQLGRLLRAMPFLRLSEGRWVFGSEKLDAQWPPCNTDRSFIILSGKVELFNDPNGVGEKVLVGPGCLFGEGRFQLVEEGTRD